MSALPLLCVTGVRLALQALPCQDNPTGVAALVWWLQMSSKLETVLQQQAAEREEQQQVLQELSQQLTDTQDQLAWLQQVRHTRALITLQPYCYHGTSILYQSSVACGYAAKSPIVMFAVWALCSCGTQHRPPHVPHGQHL